jgi:hypothetical protein
MSVYQYDLRILLVINLDPRNIMLRNYSKYCRLWSILKAWCGFFVVKYIISLVFTFWATLLSTNYLLTWERPIREFAEKWLRFTPESTKHVSSANINVSDKEFIIGGWSFEFIIKSNSPGIDSWEIPCFIEPKSGNLA